MVAVVDWVRLAGASQGKLKVLQGALVDMREEDRSEQLEDQVSSLTQEKDVLVSRLARYQRQLARANVEGVVAQGNFQWVLQKGVVRMIDRVIKSTEFAKGVHNVREDCEVVGF
ncbi:unnamed protein product [Lactuca saligna]|uniref:Uncharacterized protein n=1 Tax=Lactuca saligna TaxID=75948 RepID=A0AA35Y9Y4_LACSI|nr:unnamed protein product [Lactuca saligna]